MSKMNEDLLKAIRDNLSGQVSGELTEVIKEWEKYKSNEPKLLNSISLLENDNKASDAQIKILEKENKKLVEREESVQKQKLKNEEDARSIKMTVMEKELEMIKISKTDMLSLVNKVFGLPTVTATTSKNVGRAVPNDHYVTNINELEMKTETKSKE